MIKEDTTVAEAKMSFQSRTLRSISVLRLFEVDDVVQNGRNVLFSWLPRMVFVFSQRMRDLLLRAWVVTRTSNIKIFTFRMIWQVTSKNVYKCVSHVHHDYYYYFQPIISLVCAVAVAVVVS